MITIIIIITIVINSSYHNYNHNHHCHHPHLPPAPWSSPLPPLSPPQALSSLPPPPYITTAIITVIIILFPCRHHQLEDNINSTFSITAEASLPGPVWDLCFDSTYRPPIRSLGLPPRTAPRSHPIFFLSFHFSYTCPARPPGFIHIRFIPSPFPLHSNTPWNHSMPRNWFSLACNNISVTRSALWRM